MNLCSRCNKPLKSKKSIENGIGPTCKKKKAIEDFEKNQMTIFDIIGDLGDNYEPNYI
ncbi:DUF6011 domain-containing protein [Viridibacillus sp. FSL H8-0123]|uniref:DUF6011 domain-containing protein n=1 Tax=Viridibacillus sp. FSL H8-0123 TaxID=1928922 RepID=UPI00143C0DF5|nr:DUF6011 domain-containing protein [Viridibacillus sp. FSL H8-0123]